METFPAGVYQHNTAISNMSSDGGKKKSRGSAAAAPSSRINHVASSKSSEIAGTLPWTADDDRTILEAAEKELRKTRYVYTVHVLQHEYYIYIYMCVCVCVCVCVRACGLNVKWKN